MQYREFVESVRRFDFVPDEAAADALVKAILGILVSRIPEPEARRFTAELPSPLDFEKLRGHQARTSSAPAETFPAVVANQFGLGEDQASQLIHEVVHHALSGLPETTRREVLQNLPADWQAAVTIE